MRRSAGLIVLACGLTVGACSFPLSSLYSKDDASLDDTGFVTPASSSTATADPVLPSDGDLAYARAAAADVLARGGKDNSVPWQNPQTGASGNITPLATSYTKAGLPCRDFLASYTHGASQDWLQGAACRTTAGKWEVKQLKPLSRS